MQATWTPSRLLKAARSNLAVLLVPFGRARQNSEKIVTGRKPTKSVKSPTLPPPDLLHVERDHCEVYVTCSDGLERLCTMNRPGEAQRLADARMIVKACNAQAQAALKGGAA